MYNFPCYTKNCDYFAYLSVIWFNTKERLWGLGGNTAFKTPYGDHGFRVIVVIVGTGMLQRRETFPGTPREGVAFVWALQWQKWGGRSSDYPALSTDKQGEPKEVR